MRKLIVTEFISVDGVIEAPGGEPGYPHSGWTTAFDFVPEQFQYKLDEVVEAESLLLGRKTYEGFAAAWPERGGDEFGDKMNTMPKHVATTTLHRLDWENSSVLTGDPVGAIRTLKQADGGPILVAGSGTLAKALYAQDLVDEYRLMVFPVILGSGQRLFPDDAVHKRTVQLTGLQQFSNGVAVQTYAAGPASGR